MQWYWVMVVALVLASALLQAVGLIRFDLGLDWPAWVVAVLVLLNGGWMAFDGARALAMGDYQTPKSGPYAGQLGPWSKIVESVGLPARSTRMKVIMLAYGLLYLWATSALLFGAPWGRWGVLFLAILGLWYVPFGTLINVLVIVLLLLPALTAD